MKGFSYSFSERGGSERKQARKQYLFSLARAGVEE
jgi:hypothetical protein